MAPPRPTRAALSEKLASERVRSVASLRPTLVCELGILTAHLNESCSEDAERVEAINADVRRLFSSPTDI